MLHRYQRSILKFHQPHERRYSIRLSLIHPRTTLPPRRRHVTLVAWNNRDGYCWAISSRRARRMPGSRPGGVCNKSGQCRRGTPSTSCRTRSSVVRTSSGSGVRSWPSEERRLVFAADAISVGGTEDIVAVFQRTREQEFRLLKRDIDRLLPPARVQRSRSGAKSRHERPDGSCPARTVHRARANRLLPYGCPCGDGCVTPLVGGGDARTRTAAFQNDPHLDPADFSESSLGHPAATGR